MLGLMAKAQLLKELSAQDSRDGVTRQWEGRGTAEFSFDSKTARFSVFWRTVKY